MPQFSKILKCPTNCDLRYILRNCFSSPRSLFILITSLYEVFVRIIYFKLESGFKNVLWFRAIQFGEDRNVLNYINKLNALSLDSSIWDRIVTNEIDIADSKVKENKIKLASSYVSYTPEIYHKVFEDNENTFSIHRFKWLLVLLIENPSQETVDLGYDSIELWMSTFKRTSSSNVFEPYSISERLINWLLFVIFTKKYSKKDDIFWNKMLHSYELQISHLITNLEYHWRFTNNHILNNARSLYLCGSVLDIQHIKKIGREILLSQTDKMIKNGFLQENSSHYQMLITRSYLEILYAAEISKDVEMLKWLHPRVAQMLMVCNMLQSSFHAKEYPIFGDISPDVFPEWMLGWPFSQNRNVISKWQKLFRIKKIDISSMPVNQTITIHRDFPINRWYYISKGKFELWVIAKVCTSVTHGHADNGSIVIFYNGYPVFIDPGRYNYEKNCKSIFQLSQEAHHIPIVDDMQIDSNPGSFLRFTWFSSKFIILKITKDYIKYIITSFDNKLKLIREITLQKESVIIEDTFYIKTIRSKITYNQYWYTCEKIDLFGNKAVIKMGPKLFEFAVNSDQPITPTVSDTFRSQSYGELEQCFRLGFSGEINSNQKITTELKLYK